MDGYKRGGHTKYSLKVHIILVTKYRKQVFKRKERSDDIKQFVNDISKQKGYEIIEMETDKDHIHILIEYYPKVSVTTIVTYIKQYTTYKMWNYHLEYLSTQYWKKIVLWSDGYFACSIGQVSQDVIEKYIQNQG